MSEHAEFRRPSYSKYDDDLFKTKWSEILSPNGVRPTVELDGPDMMPQGIVIQEARAAVTEQQAVEEVPETRASLSFGDMDGQNRTANLTLTLPPSLQETDASGTAQSGETNARGMLGTDGNAVSLSLDMEAMGAQDTPGTPIQASVVIQEDGGNGGIRLTLPQRHTFGSNPEEDFAGAAGNNWEVWIEHSSLEGQSNFNRRDRAAQGPSQKGRFRVGLRNQSSFQHLKDYWDSIFGSGTAVLLPGTSSGGTFVSRDNYYYPFSGGAATQATVDLMKSGSTTEGLRLRLPPNQVLPSNATQTGQTRNHWGDLMDFAGTVGNNRSVSVITGTNSLRFRNNAVANRFTLEVQGTTTFQEIKTFWASWAGSGQVELFGGADFADRPATHASNTEAYNFSGGVDNVAADIPGTALVKSATRGATDGLTLTMPTGGQFDGDSGNGWDIRITTGGTAETTIDSANRNINMVVAASTLQAVHDAWEAAPINGTAAVAGSGLLADAVHADSLYSPTANQQATARVLGLGSSYIDLKMPPTSNWHGINMLGTAPVGRSVVSVWFGQARTVHSPLYGTGENFRIRRRYAGSQEYVDIMFAGYDPTLNDLKTAWETARIDEPSAPLHSGRGRGGAGTDAVATIHGTGSSRIRASQGNVAFTGGTNFVEDATRVTFAGGSGFRFGMSSYVLQDNTDTLFLRLKGGTAGDLRTYWESIGGSIAMTGDAATRIDDITTTPIPFQGGVSYVAPQAYRAASNEVQAVTRTGNSTPDSKLRLQYNRRVANPFTMVVDRTQRISRKARGTVNSETVASTIVADADGSTTGGLELTLPAVLPNSSRIRTTGSGTFNSCGPNGNAYDLRFEYADDGALGGASWLLVDFGNSTLTATIEKNGSSNPSLGDLRELWEHIGGSVSLTGDTGVDKLMADATTYATADQTFSGGMNAYIKLNESPAANSLIVKDPNTFREIVLYSQVANEDDLEAGEKHYWFDVTNRTLRFDRTWHGKALDIEYDLENDFSEARYIGRNTFVLTVGENATWTTVARDLNADSEFMRYFDKVMLGTGGDLLLPSEHMGNASDKPTPGIYQFSEGSASSSQRAVVSTGDHDVSLIVGEPPRTERFQADTASPPNTFVLEAVPVEGSVSLKHENPGVANQFANPETDVSTVVSAGKWHVDPATRTVTYQTATAGTVSVKYISGIDDDKADIAEANSEEEIVVDPGKSLYAKTATESGGSIEAYDDRTDYRWVEGFRGIPREAA